jgi:two-component system LytT family response regulator
VIRTLDVDDEPIARRGLLRHLRAEADVEVVGECGDGAAAVAAIGSLAPDLVFLDVQMPEMDGVGVVEAIGLGQMPAVVFVTAYDQHAVRAFDVHAVDYLLKPVEAERFGRALARARERLAGGRGANDRLSVALGELGREPRRHARRLAIRSGDRVTLVDVGDVARLQAAGNYVEVHAGGQCHLLRETLTGLLARLDPDRFVRVSRSAAVAAEHVRELRSLFDGDCLVVLRDGSKVPASRRYRHRLDALF